MEEEKLLRKLGIKHYTDRHIYLITDFIKSGKSNVKIILNRLGSWDDADHLIAQKWYEELKK